MKVWEPCSEAGDKMNTKEIDKKYVSATYGRFDVELVSGKGSTLYDVYGQ